MTDRDAHATENPRAELPELTDPIVIAGFEGWNAGLTPLPRSNRSFGGGFA
ncbi:hypothetical protein [Saccharopolyspora antimicrobica]|uniref:hypothetical protein n=1 Tax=Saccharopolyspora antimicrobica TaxID=455193 RepID=UPI0015A5FD9B|nr:hypothetical protein [Saccharopolyspora antimicrobica]